ncbi:phosphatidate cytidylyltransferase, mitochondrial-like [Liolophura sinensis]|uniref:phosphatidate cytidylyltransferase, mitochondrial-like n=1 Tax=Liolophura sinensis TaxID=3198878 RepID=UPI0031583150
MASASIRLSRVFKKESWCKLFPLGVRQVQLFSSYLSERKSTSAHLVESPLHRILSHLPGQMQMAFAYGSGVFQQEGHKDFSQNMIDFIIAVDDPVSWHRENIKVNGKHYSFLKYFGPRYINRVQSQYGAGVYFNTLVPCEGRLIKYGVIGTDKLEIDLLDWETLYVSGRLHKPVKMLKAPSKSSLIAALDINLKSAVHAALLLLPDEFSEIDLYTTIAGLSYNGDFRMVIGEDRNKVSNIVRPNVERFRKLYENILDNEEHIFWNKSKGFLEQYPNHAVQYHHLNLLPKMVQMNLVAVRNVSGRYYDTEEVIRSFAHSSQCDEYVAKSIEEIVRKSSRSQSIKTIFTAGLKKSIVYSCKKLKKMVKGSNKI